MKKEEQYINVVQLENERFLVYAISSLSGFIFIHEDSMIGMIETCEQSSLFFLFTKCTHMEFLMGTLHSSVLLCRYFLPVLPAHGVRNTEIFPFLPFHFQLLLTSWEPSSRSWSSVLHCVWLRRGGTHTRVFGFVNPSLNVANNL